VGAIWRSDSEERQDSEERMKRRVVSERKRVGTEG
jgi:hypothetical protein